MKALLSQGTKVALEPSSDVSNIVLRRPIALIVCLWIVRANISKLMSDI